MIDLLFLDKGICYCCQREPIVKYNLCQDCLDKLDYLANEFKISGNTCYSIYFYNDFMKKLIGSYKFNRNTSLAETFAMMAVDFIREKSLTDFDYILASPSSRKTLNHRGFDHIGLIVDYISRELNIKEISDFKKIKNTRAQHTLAKEERIDNLRGAFKLDRDIEGARILLVDDLITTANTILEITKELKKRKAREVVSLAIASERGDW